MAEVKLIKVDKIYPNGFQATYNLNMEIKDGEFMVFVGPSGCAKSTTLNMIAGLEEVSEGHIMIDNKIVDDIPPKDRNIAMVFQSYALYPHMNVYENMAFGLKLKHLSKSEIKVRVEEAAKILGIENLMDRKPKQLSGGQRQRVAVGRAIVRKPKVFLFDEPLSNLDAKLRVQMRVEISKLHHRLKTTMIYVTHDQTEAMTMGDRICVMDRGYIQQIDTPLNLYEYPINQFVATFIGSPSMNIIPGKITDRDNEFIFVSSDGDSLVLNRLNKENLELYKDKEVNLGIRPEFFTLSDKKTTCNVINSKVDVLENLGNELLAYFNYAGSQLIARISAHSKLNVHEKCTFEIDQAKIHIFDKQTGKNILLEPRKNK